MNEINALSEKSRAVTFVSGGKEQLSSEGRISKKAATFKRTDKKSTSPDKFVMETNAVQPSEHMSYNQLASHPTVKLID